MNYKISQIVVLLFFVKGFCFSQDNLTTKNFYLVDNLDLKKIPLSELRIVDSVLNLYHESKEDTAKLGLINHLIETCRDDKVWTAYNQYMHDYAIKLLNNSAARRNIESFKRISNYLSLAINNNGVLSYYQGKMDEALFHFHKSIDISEKAHFDVGLCESYNNIGGIYYSQKDFETALFYFNKSIALNDKSISQISHAKALSNIGTIYANLEELDSAEFYFNKCLRIYTYENDKSGIASCYYKIAGLQSKYGNFELADSFLLQSIRINQEIKDDRMIINAYQLLGKMHFEQNNLSLAKTYAQRSFKLANDIGYPEGLKEAAYTLHHIYQRENNFKDALDMLELYINMKDSILSDKVKEDIKNRQLTYDYEKRALADSLKYAKKNMYNLQEIAKKDAKIKQDSIIRTLLIIGFLLMIVFIIFIYIALKKIRFANQKIAVQKKNVENQRDLLNKQYVLTETQSSLLQSKNREILDSINYAKRLQEAILPSDAMLQENLKDGFILYKPKDIVAGDFYWVDKKEDFTYFAVADCTGHGVPGAIVSVVCLNALNSVMLQYELPKPNEILDAVTGIITKVFERGKHQINDGMDIGLCAWNRKTNMLYFSGAYNPLWIVSSRNQLDAPTLLVSNETDNLFLHEITGTRQPVGHYHDSIPFELHQVQLQKGDCLYLITDGYPDQFGGEKGKKLKYKQLKSLILESMSLDMDDQGKILEEVYVNWMGDLEQIDDVCIMGIRI